MKIEECALFSFLKLFYCLIRIIYIMKKYQVLVIIQNKQKKYYKIFGFF